MYNIVFLAVVSVIRTFSLPYSEFEKLVPIGGKRFWWQLRHLSVPFQL